DLLPCSLTGGVDAPSGCLAEYTNDLPTASEARSNQEEGSEDRCRFVVPEKPRKVCVTHYFPLLNYTRFSCTFDAWKSFLSGRAWGRPQVLVWQRIAIAHPYSSRAVFTASETKKVVHSVGRAGFLGPGTGLPGTSWRG